MEHGAGSGEHGAGSREPQYHLPARPGSSTGSYPSEMGSSKFHRAGGASMEERVIWFVGFG